MATSGKRLFRKYIDKMNSFNKDKNVEAIYDSLLNGRNSYLRLSKKGSSRFDPRWITVIEDCLFDLGDIINNPSEVTATDSSITPIELAKKIDGKSVQHLASHSQYVKEIDENGNVIPSKILSHSNVQDFHTYENRFIATFVRRLVLFIEKRYEFIHSNLNLTKEDVLMIKNKSIVDGQEVEIETKVTIRREEKDKSTVEAKEYIERIKSMREYVQFYYTSPFMKMMKNERDVRKPIIQTNILRKNPKYRKCYETFLFIEKFDSLGVSYHLNENYQSFDEEERRKMNFLMLSGFLSAQTRDRMESIKVSNKVYKPKFLTSMDDEMFTYGDILKGPIEFVRIDQTYRDYLRSKIKADLPEHPNKYEKAYYEEEYDYKREQKLDSQELDQLINRKKREIAAYEKYLEKLIAQRDKEEAEQRRKELEAIKAYQEGLIALKRKKIIEEAEANKIPYDINDDIEPERTIEDNSYLDDEIPLEEPSRSEEYGFDAVVENAEEELVEENEPEEPVYTEIPSESSGNEESAPIAIEPISESTPISEPVNKEYPEEELLDENAFANNEVVYFVSDDAEIREVDGHKEMVYYSSSYDDLDNASNEVTTNEPNEEVYQEVIDVPKENETLSDESEGEIVYYVQGDAEVVEVDGHKEYIYQVDDEDK